MTLTGKEVAMIVHALVHVSEVLLEESRGKPLERQEALLDRARQNSMLAKRLLSAPGTEEP